MRHIRILKRRIGCYLILSYDAEGNDEYTITTVDRIKTNFMETYPQQVSLVMAIALAKKYEPNTTNVRVYDRS
jgi:hypothetical protein